MTEASSSSPHPAPHPDGLSMLEKRRIEAEILKEVYLTLKESHGEEMAKKTIAESVRRSAIEQAQAFAAAAPGGPSLKAFQDVMPLWTKGGALEAQGKADQSAANLKQAGEKVKDPLRAEGRPLSRDAAEGRVRGSVTAQPVVAGRLVRDHAGVLKIEVPRDCASAEGLVERACEASDRGG
jgi:hypothetical protein